VKHKRLLSVSLVCVLLISGILVVWSASTRLIRAYDYASQLAAPAAPAAGSSTNLSLLIYSDPQSLRQGIDLFQLVKAQNIEWKGTSTDAQGNAVNIAFKLGSVNFGKSGEYMFNGNATGLDAHVSLGDLLDVTMRADKVDINITFWTYLGTFPAVNITGVLTDHVYVRLSVAVLPFPGLDLALYEYSGDKFSASICAMKPMNLAIVNPANNQRVSNDVTVQATIQVVPELNLENAWFGTDYGENMPLQYNEGNGLWECVWQTYHCGNGGHNINVHAEAVDREGGQEIARYRSDTGVWVEVSNPSVNSYMDKGQGLEGFGGLEVILTQGSNSWKQGTGFPIWLGLQLEAPQYWAGGQLQFNCWRIDDEQGNTAFQHNGFTLTIDPGVASKLFDGGGRARELKCIYVPNVPT
jgi:hypothetical protein